LEPRGNLFSHPLGVPSASTRSIFRVIHFLTRAGKKLGGRIKTDAAAELQNARAGRAGGDDKPPLAANRERRCGFFLSIPLLPLAFALSRSPSIRKICRMGGGQRLKMADS
jgi:hypothetical protein